MLKFITFHLLADTAEMAVLKMLELLECICVIYDIQVILALTEPATFLGCFTWQVLVRDIK